MEFPKIPYQIKPDFILDISFPKRPSEIAENERGGEDVGSMNTIGNKHYKTTATFLWDALTIRQFVDLMNLLDRIKSQSGMFYLNPSYHPFSEEVLQAYLRQTGSCFYVLDGTPKIETVQSDLYRLRVNVVNYPLFIDFAGSRYFIYSNKEYQHLNQPKYINLYRYRLNKVFGEIEKNLKIFFRSNCPEFDLEIESAYSSLIRVIKVNRGFGFILNPYDPDKKLCHISSVINVNLLPYGDEEFKIPITLTLGGSDGVSTGTFTPLDIYLSDGEKMVWDLSFISYPPDIITRVVDAELEAYLANGMGDYIVVPETQFVSYSEQNPILLGRYRDGFELGVNVVFNIIGHAWGNPERYIIYKYNEGIGWQQENIILESACPAVIEMSLDRWYKYAVEVRMPNDDLDTYWSHPIYIQKDQIVYN